MYPVWPESTLRHQYCAVQTQRVGEKCSGRSERKTRIAETWLPIRIKSVAQSTLRSLVIDEH